MKLFYKDEYGPLYSEKSNNSIFKEPTYFEIDSKDNLNRIVDEKGHYTYQNNKLHKIKPKNLGAFGSNSGYPLVMDEKGNSLEYGSDLLEVSMSNKLYIKTTEKEYCYEYDTEVEPDTIQIFDDKVLLNLKLRQMVVLVSTSGKILNSFGLDRYRGEGQKQLNVPMFSVYIEDKNSILISDAINSRVIEVDKKGNIIWKYGEDGLLGSDQGLLWKPTCARRLSNGNTIIADSKNNRLVTISPDKNIVNEIGQTNVSKLLLTYPRSVQMLDKNNWLVTNTHKNSVFIMNQNQKKIIKPINDSYNKLNLFWPRCSIKNSNDEIIIADGKNNRIVFIDDKTLQIKKVIDSYYEQGNRMTIIDPHDIKINPKTNLLLITLSGNDRVIEITRDGELIECYDNLNDPHSAYYFSDGIIIANTEDNNIVIYYFSGKKEFINNFKSTNSSCDAFKRPRYALPYKNGFLILDTDNQRIIFLKKENNEWIGKNVPIYFPDGPIMNYLCFPRCITLNNDNELILTDTENCRILRFVFDDTFIKEEHSDEIYC
ncbi:hypothetical protein [Bacillus nakamurai]|uniref:hypothetical protein n=1 Tax=Bacillus nakamurai TaxID=1793963 RepID=UPI001E626822|nr:hypothetical protein [Bacillus nakamurai]MCC9022351.1 hypothetical protein [Bacillus nakamurai]